MSDRVTLPPVDYRVESIFSIALDNYVNLIIMNEEDTHAYVTSFPLEKMNSRMYVETIVMTHLENPEIVQDMPQELYNEFLVEIFQHLVMINSCLQLGHIIKEIRAKKTKEQSKSISFDPSEVYNIIREHLKEVVVGQNEAVDEVIKAVGRGLLRKNTNRKRPIVSMLFAGISGSGKSFIAKELANGFVKAGIVDKKDSIIMVNAGEYGDSHQLNRLIGAPLGYIGSDQDSVFEKRIKPDKIQVLLVDEIEKAHNKMYDFLLGILEEGTVSSGKNSTIDMTNTVVILTSNVGSKELVQHLQGGLGFKTETIYDKNAVIKNVKKSMPVEFTNRLNSIIIFSEPTEDEAKQVVRLELEQLRERLDHLIDIEWDEAVENILVKDLPRETGLRPVRTRVESVESDLSDKILGKQLSKNCPVYLSVKDKRVVVKE